MITSAWVSPNGDIHPVNSHKHAAFARDTLNVKDVSNHAVILMLADLGWLHIGFASFVSTIPYHKLSENQAITVHKLVHETSGLVQQNLISYIHA